jgi:hypothetical protein
VTDGARRDPSDQLLDTLLAAATARLRRAEPNFDDLARLEANLTEDDIKALDAAGPACVEEIVSGGKIIRKPEIFVPSTCEEPRFGTAMNRGNDDLTEKAREEIERKISEAPRSTGEGDVNDARD